MIHARSRIIILNGVGSAGKGSIARALQAITTAPFLHVEMDAFLGMLPASMLGHPDGIVFEAVQQDGSPMVIIRNGEVARRCFRGMRHAIAAMAAEGNNMIVDEVMLGEQMAEYTALLAPVRPACRRGVRTARGAGGARTPARRPDARPRALAVRSRSRGDALRP
jgi:chloramphenicol 3-O-phosphotransferase